LMAGFVIVTNRRKDGAADSTTTGRTAEKIAK
jgi:hypothetical protein